MSEREVALSSEREREAVEIIFMFLGFTTAIGAHSISEEVAGFSLFLLSLVFIAVHVILLDKILR